MSPGSSWNFNSARTEIHYVKLSNLPVCSLYGHKLTKSYVESMEETTLKNIPCCYQMLWKRRIDKTLPIKTLLQKHWPRGLIFKLLEIKVHPLKSWHREESDMVGNPVQFSTVIIHVIPNHIKIIKQQYWMRYLQSQSQAPALLSLSLQLPASVCRAWAELALKFRFFRTHLLAGTEEREVSSFPVLTSSAPFPPQQSTAGTRAAVGKGWN